VEILGVRPGAHYGAAFARARLAGLLQLLRHLAAGKRDLPHRALARDAHLEAPGERVGHRHADTVQPTGEGVGAAALLVELAARVQAREDHLDRGRLLDRVRTDRNAAAVVG